MEAAAGSGIANRAIEMDGGDQIASQRRGDFVPDSNDEDIRRMWHSGGARLLTYIPYQE